MRAIRLADTVGFRLSGPETAQSENQGEHET